MISQLFFRTSPTGLWSEYSCSIPPQPHSCPSLPPHHTPSPPVLSSFCCILYELWVLPRGKQIQQGQPQETPGCVRGALPWDRTCPQPPLLALHLFGDVIYTSGITNQSLAWSKRWPEISGHLQLSLVFETAKIRVMVCTMLEGDASNPPESWFEVCGMGLIWSQVPAYTWAEICPSPERQVREINISAGLSFVSPDFWLLQCKCLELSLLPGPLLRVNEEKLVPFWVWFIWPILPACLGMWDEQRWVPAYCLVPPHWLQRKSRVSWLTSTLQTSKNQVKKNPSLPRCPHQTAPGQWAAVGWQ